MELKKYLVLPFLVCAFTLGIFVFQIDRNTFWDLSYFHRSILTIYNINLLEGNSTYNKTQLSLHSPQTTKFGGKFIQILNTTLPKSQLISTSLSVTPHASHPVVTSQVFSTSRIVTSIQNVSSPTAQPGTQPHKVMQTLLTLVTSTSLPTGSGEQDNTTHYLCPNFLGGLGNILFQFATHFGAAMAKGMPIAMKNDTELYRVFKLNVVTENVSNICQKFTGKSARLDCAYDDNLMKFNNTSNIRLNTYLQSWKYFYDYRDSLRKELVFRDHVQSEAKAMLEKELQDLKIKSRPEVVLIGVHIRRGDMVNNSYGYNVASPEYLSKAVQYFKNKYLNSIFIVSSLDLQWAKTYFPKNVTVRYVNHNKREVITALLSLCDHTITTVGSFGWWIGWLTGGEVTYFKWPAKEGSRLRKQYSKDYSDFFYPGWVGL